MLKYLLLICTLWLSFCPSQAQPSKTLDFARATSLTQLPEWRQRGLMWTTQSWTGDDKPYVTIRQNIDKAIARGTKADTLMTSYGKKAVAKPNDPQAVFGWTYAAWLARNQFYNHDEQAKRIVMPRQALELVSFPRTYQFARLLFLVQAWQPSLPQFLVDTGYKLLRRNPNDYEVKYYLARVLAMSIDPKKQQQALTFVRQFIQKNPKKPSYYSLMGGIHWQEYRKTNQRADAEKAIAAYRKYLELAPADDEWRPRAQALILALEKDL